MEREERLKEICDSHYIDYQKVLAGIEKKNPFPKFIILCENLESGMAEDNKFIFAHNEIELKIKIKKAIQKDIDYNYSLYKTVYNLDNSNAYDPELKIMTCSIKLNPVEEN
jgi:hypothetical protein